MLAFYPNNTSVLKNNNKYVGYKACTMCHKSDKQGEQEKIWEGSKHSKAFEVLKSEEAEKIAGEKGLKTKAFEAKECLKCHVTAYGVDASLLEKKFNVEDGVQCEACHGAGSEYKSMKTMKDHASAVAAGLADLKDTKNIKKLCETCHNSESPTFKEFKFEEMWAKIKHPIPNK
ncbi:MAG: cytochrome C554 [Ignavibacteria bacterium RBG_13_36_8]|nr:MAG: cytochrome C554 [Ignavibacteria bacterium RBG_13_36_8]